MKQAISRRPYRGSSCPTELGPLSNRLLRFCQPAARSTARLQRNGTGPIDGARRASVRLEAREPAPIFPLARPQTKGTNIESAREALIAWTKDFLARPHQDLGVPGRPVCPFVPLALKKNSLWLQVIEGETVSPERVREVLNSLRQQFPSLAPCGGKDAQFKAAILAFPDMHPGAAASLIDHVQRQVKGDFVEQGLMIGEFHLLNGTPGLHNPAFFPLQAPVASLAIRFMVESDLPFLVDEKYSLVERERFLRAFLGQPFNQSVEGARRELAAICAALSKIDASKCIASVDEQVRLAEREEQ